MLLDSDSNIATFNNKNVVSNIKESKSNVNISTNGKGNLKAMITYEVINLKCKSCFNKESMTNIISLVDIAEECQITMDTKVEKAMLVYMKNKIVRF